MDKSNFQLRFFNNGKEIHGFSLQENWLNVTDDFIKGVAVGIRCGLLIHLRNPKVEVYNDGVLMWEAK